MRVNHHALIERYNVRGSFISPRLPLESCMMGNVGLSVGQRQHDVENGGGNDDLAFRRVLGPGAFLDSGLAVVMVGISIVVILE